MAAKTATRKETNMDEKNNISGERNLPKICDVSEVSVKELFAELTVQSALKQLLPIRLPVMVKKVRKSYENKETHTTTQRIEGIFGTSLEDMIPVSFTLVETTLDPVEAINKKYRLVDYTFALVANMDGKNFTGYSATGLKLMVTKIEEVKVDNK